MKNSNMLLSRGLTAITVTVLVFALTMSGALAGFWRTIDGISANGVPNPMDFLFGQGTDGTTNGIFGYGYGYGNGDFGYGFVVAPSASSSGGSSNNSSTSSSSSTSGGSTGGSSSSSSSSSGWSSVTLDNCPNGDTSGSRTDGTCGDTTSSSSSSSTSSGWPTPTPNPSDSCVYPNLNVSYNDTNGAWALAYINDLSSKGIMNGVNAGLMNPTGSFEPNRATTRIEMLKIALRTFCYEYKDLQGIENFGDVPNGSWQARVVELANSMNIIDASNANFRPNDTVARAEAIKMLLNVGATRTSNLAVDQSVTTTSFSDVTVTWQAKYFSKAQGLSIMNGQNGNIRPMDNVTRSETSKIAKLSQDQWNGWTQSQ